MTTRLVEKNHLSAKGLLRKAKEVFEKVKEPLKGAQGEKKQISIADCLMSALAVFKLKFSSLLQFEMAQEEEPIKQNLKNLFSLTHLPCDTYMRERLDEVNPNDIRTDIEQLGTLPPILKN